MAETYTTLTATPEKQAPVVVRVELPGIPHKFSGLNSGGSDGDGSTSYSVAPVSFLSQEPSNYTAQQKVGYRYGLRGVSLAGQQHDPVQMSVRMGSAVITLQDGADNYLADLFAPALGSQTTSLSSTLSRTATTISTAANVTQGTVYFIGRESFVPITTGTSVTIRRGADCANSRQYPHTVSTDSERHADEIYTRPRTWIGQPVHIYLGYDHSDVDQTDELGPLRYVLTGAPTLTAQGAWVLRCDDAMREVAKSYALGRFAAVSAGTDNRLQPVERNDEVFGASGNPDIWQIGSSLALIPKTDQYTQPAFNADNDDVYLLVGDTPVRASIVSSEADRTWVQIEELGILGRGSTRAVEIEPDDDVAEFIPTDDQVASPRIGYVTDPTGAATFTASSHVVDAFLCLLLSRDGTDGDAGSGSDRNYDSTEDISWDLLPEPWGLAYDASAIDYASFQRAKEEWRHAQFRGFMLGAKGGDSLLKWWNKEVAGIVPLALYHRSNGNLAVADLGDVYPADSSATIDMTNVSDDGVSYQVTSGEDVGRVVSTYRLREGVKVRLEVESVRARELFPTEVRILERRSEGIDDESAAGTLRDMSLRLLAWAATSSPYIDLEVMWRLHDGTGAGVELGDRVSLTLDHVPDPANGGYGISGDSLWKVVGYELMAPTDGRSGAKLRLRRQNYNTGNFGPCATVVSGTTTLTVAANDFTPTATNSDVVPTSDVEGFAVGEYIELWSSAGVRLTDAQAIDSINTGTPSITVGSGWTAAGGGGYTPGAGDVVRLARYLDAIVAAAPPATQDDYLTMAASGAVNSTTSPYKWGG